MFWEPGLWEKFLLIARKLPPRCRSNNDDDDDDFVVEEECVCLHMMMILMIMLTSKMKNGKLGHLRIWEVGIVGNHCRAIS